MWQLIVCATLSCSAPVDTGKRLSLDECQSAGLLMVRHNKTRRAVCRSDAGELWATGRGWRPRLEVAR